MHGHIQKQDLMKYARNISKATWYLRQYGSLVACHIVTERAKQPIKPGYVAVKIRGTSGVINFEVPASLVTSHSKKGQEELETIALMPGG